MAERRAKLRLRPSEQRIILLLGDLLFGLLALAIAIYVWHAFWRQAEANASVSLWWFARSLPDWFFLLPFGWLVLLVDLYDPHHARNRKLTLGGIALSVLIALVLYALIYLPSEPGSLPRIGVGAFLAAAAILTALWRLAFIQVFTSPGMLQRVLVVGAGKAGRTLVAAYRTAWPPPFRLLGLIDDDPAKIGAEIDGFRVLTGSASLLEEIERLRVDTLIVAITGEIEGRTLQILLDAQERGVEIVRMPSVYEEMLGRVPIHHLETDWMVRSFVDEARAGGYYELFKRLLDIVGGLVGTLFFLAFTPIAALAILLDSGRPVFYSQTRLGRGGRLFKIYKFRTMIREAEPDGRAVPASENDPRITRVGNFLRVTRLDELPQFLNVLRGEMSLVGPRAERPELVLKYQQEIPFYRARLLVKPGLTGWSQVNYGYAATVEDTTIKLEYDLYYIKHRTLYLDLLILLRTIGTVLRRRGR